VCDKNSEKQRAQAAKRKEKNESTMRVFTPTHWGELRRRESGISEKKVRVTKKINKEGPKRLQIASPREGIERKTNRVGSTQEKTLNTRITTKNSNSHI